MRLLEIRPAENIYYDLCQNPRGKILLHVCAVLADAYIFLRLAWRARKQPEYLRHIGERFGFYAQRVEKPLIWLHAVSVGETRATVSWLPITRPLSRPSNPADHTTPTGRATSTQLYGDSVIRVYLPTIIRLRCANSCGIFIRSWAS